jgi:hypothetical protein
LSFCGRNFKGHRTLQFRTDNKRLAAVEIKHAKGTANPKRLVEVQKPMPTSNERTARTSETTGVTLSPPSFSMWKTGNFANWTVASRPKTRKNFPGGGGPCRDAFFPQIIRPLRPNVGVRIPASTHNVIS